MSDEPARIAVVILAAGQSRRFGGEAGGSKVVADLHGDPLVRVVAKVALGSRAASVTVVSGRDRSKIESALDGLAVGLVFNPEFASGMASSLKAGLAALPADSDGMLVMLADMPLVRAATLEALIAHFDQRRKAIDAVVPTFRGERGNPVLIGSRLFPLMRQLRGDKGARDLLSAPGLEIDPCEVDDPGIAIDIDTPAALERVRKAGSDLGRGLAR